MNDFKQVKIPEGFWFRSSTKDYYNWKTSLFREFIQNSKDAGASRLKVVYDIEIGMLEFLDNGCGMDVYTIEHALLTLGGSYKEEGSIGGHGKAKELIYFSWPQWSIHSGDNFVEGKEGNYRIDKVSKITKGTHSKIKINGKIKDPLLTLQSYLMLCNMDMEVIVDNSVLTQGSRSIRSEKIYEIPGLGDLYKNETDGYGVHVQVNGLFMFTMSTVLDKSYIFNITQPSYDCLNSSRDGFVGEWQDKFSKMVGKIAIDSESTKLIKEKVLYINRIKLPNTYMDEALRTVKDSQIGDAIAAFSNCNKKDLTSEQILEWMDEDYAITESVIDTESKRVLQVLVKASKQTRSFRGFINWYKKTFEEGFVIVSELEFDKKTVKTLKYRTQMQMSYMWRDLVLHVFDVLGTKPNIGFGIIESETVEAQLRDGKYFLLNTIMQGEKCKDHWKVYAYKLMLVACHEVTHYLGYHYHNESFLNTFEEIVWKVLQKGFEPKYFVRRIRKISKNMFKD